MKSGKFHTITGLFPAHVNSKANATWNFQLSSADIRSRTSDWNIFGMASFRHLEKVCNQLQLRDSNWRQVRVELTLGPCRRSPPVDLLHVFFMSLGKLDGEIPIEPIRRRISTLFLLF
jgi:hypothetical protein